MGTTFGFGSYQARRSFVAQDEDPFAHLERRHGLAQQNEPDPFADLESRFQRPDPQELEAPRSSSSESRAFRSRPIIEPGSRVADASWSLAQGIAQSLERRASVPPRPLPGIAADASRAEPRDSNSIDQTLNPVERAAGMVVGFGREAVQHPFRTAASLVTDPLRSAINTFLRPVEGERVPVGSSLQWKGYQPPPWLKPGELVTEETPGAISAREHSAAALQTLANVAAGPIGVRVGSTVARRLTSPTAGAVLGAAAGAAPVGASYAPDDPLAGALAASTAGGAMGGLARGGAELVRQGRAARQRKQPAAPTSPIPASDPLAALETTHGLAAEPVRATPRPTRAVDIVRVPVEEIRVDPSRFQFKRGLDPEAGVGSELKGLSQFDESLAGVVSVWRDPADGSLYAVNGHHRIELARRTGHPSINVQLLEAGTAGEARAMGAIANIAEGRGTAIDAATFFRDAGMGPEQLADRVSFKGAIARRGQALSRLVSDVFDRAARGEVPEEHAVAVGEMLDDPILQRTAIRAAESSTKRLTEGEVRELARQVREAGTEIVSQGTLFGDEQIAQALWVEKAQLAEAVRKHLTTDQRLFGYVAKEGRAEELARAGNVIDVNASRGIAQSAAELTEAFQQLYTRSGPVSEALTDGARRLARGESLKAVTGDLYPVVQAHLRTALPRGQGASDPALGARDPHGEPPPGPDAAGRQAERGAEPTEVASPPDPNQAALFAPRRDPVSALESRYGLDALASPERPASSPADRDLFGEPGGTEPAQGALFDERSGTAAARSLAQHESAAGSEVARLRQVLALESDPARRQAVAAEIAGHERLLNRDNAITSKELATRLEGEGSPGTPTLPSQGTLFSPATARTPLGKRLRQALGVKRFDTQGVQSLERIARSLAKAVEVPLSQGRFYAKQRRAAGAFFPHAETTRVRRFDQLDTVAHEIGHYLSKRHLRNPTRRGATDRGAPVLSRSAMRELVQMGRDLYGERKPNAGYGEEGIAEWVSHYVTNPDVLSARAPEFSKVMSTLLEAEADLANALKEAQGRFRDYQAADANQRTDALLSVNERVRNLPTVEMVVRAVFDDLDPVRRAMEALGKAKTAREDAYTLARLTRGSAGIAEEMIERGVTDFATGERSTPSIVQALRQVPRGRMQAFRRYLTSERTIELASRGVDSGQPLPDAVRIVETTKSEFSKPADVVWAYSKALLEYRRDAGLLTRDQFNSIWRANQKRVGFYRVFDPTETGAGRGRGREMAKSGPGLYAARGSARRIIDPLESVLADVYHTVAQSNAHHAAQTLLDAALSTEGGGRIAEIVEPPKRSVSIPAERLKGQIVERMQELGIDVPDSAVLEDWQGVFTSFEEKAMAGGAESKDLVLPILRNGERVWVQVHDPNLYNALLGLDKPQLEWWWRWLSLPTRTLRAGATLTAEFMARNPVRDAWTASVFSRAGFRPPGWDLGRGLFHALRKDETYQRWRLEGGDNAAMLGLDRPQVQSELRRLTASRGKQAADIVLHPIDQLRMLSNLMENSTRLGEFGRVERQALDRMNVSRDKANPAERRAASSEAAMAARDITIDFARAGHVTRAANQLIEFLNAQVQDNAKIVRELRERPGIVLPRILATITMPSLALWLLQKDDPAYQELPRWRRDFMWSVVQRNERGEVEHIWSFPKPFGLGILFGTVPERIAEWIQNDDPAAFDHLAETLVTTFNPLKLPTIFRPPVENWANRQFFGYRPVVPPSTQNLEPAEQVALQTGPAARAVGRAIDYSPAKIENLVRGYTGGLGVYGLRAADVGAALLAGKDGDGVARRRRRDPLANVPGLRAFIAPEPGADAESVQRLYEAYEKAEAKRQTLKRLSGAEADEYFAKHRDLVASVATAEETGGESGWLREAWRELQRLHSERRQMFGTSLPDKVKQQHAAAIEREMVRLARLALGRSR